MMTENTLLNILKDFSNESKVALLEFIYWLLPLQLTKGVCFEHALLLCQQHQISLSKYWPRNSIAATVVQPNLRPLDCAVSIPAQPYFLTTSTNDDEIGPLRRRSTSRSAVSSPWCVINRPLQRIWIGKNYKTTTTKKLPCKTFGPLTNMYARRPPQNCGDKIRFRKQFISNVLNRYNCELEPNVTV